jgi:hypothetical protein
LTRPVDGGRIAFFYDSGWTAVLDVTTGDPVWSRAIGSTLLIPGRWRPRLACRRSAACSIPVARM